MKNRLLNGLITCIILFSAMACDNNVKSPDSDFESQIYTITAGDIYTQLNINSPKYIDSKDRSIATAAFNANGDIEISSVKNGSTSVYVGDSVGLRNSAIMDVNVDASGKISIQKTTKYPSSGSGGVIKVLFFGDGAVIGGTVGNEITPQTIGLRMDGTYFTDCNIGDNANAWITNLPQGLSAEITVLWGKEPERPRELDIEISGTPTVVCADVPISVTIPGEYAAGGGGWDIYVAINTGVKFNITD